MSYSGVPYLILHVYPSQVLRRDPQIHRGDPTYDLNDAHECCKDPRWCGYNTAPGHEPEWYHCQNCKAILIRDWVREPYGTIKGGSKLLYNLPRRSTRSCSRLALVVVKGADWVNSVFTYKAVMSPGFTARTIVRGAKQSANCSLLPADHSLPHVDCNQFIERFNSLTGGSVLDEKWMAYKETWATCWVQSMPAFELMVQKYLLEDFDAWPQVSDKTHQRRPDPLSTHF